MKIIIGLGNPGSQYKKTRHNIGFRSIETLAQETNLSFELSKKFQAEIAKKDGLLLVKPQTFMNESGRSARALMDFYKLAPTDFTVIYDDKDLPLGEIRTKGESAGGHKGMQSIIDHLGTTEIKRFRIGIFSPNIKDTSDFVLDKFSAAEEKVITETIKKVVQEIIKQ